MSDILLYFFFLSGKAFLGPCRSRGEQKQTTGPLACSLAGPAESLFAIRGEGRGVPRLLNG